MRRLVGLTVALILAAVTTSQSHAAPAKPDTTPPQVSISTESIPGAPIETFLVSVAATDDVGISKAFVSLDGVIVEGRTVGTFSAVVTAQSFPVQVCAVADDLAGNSGRACVTVNQCANNTDCASTDFCSKTTGDCNGTGACQQRPTFCPQDIDPVCGCDGATYVNPCAAAAAGINVAHAGNCP